MPENPGIPGREGDSLRWGDRREGGSGQSGLRTMQLYFNHSRFTNICFILGLLNFLNNFVIWNNFGFMQKLQR